MRHSRSQRGPSPRRTGTVRASASQGSFSPRNAAAWPPPHQHLRQDEYPKSPKRSSPRRSSPRRSSPRRTAPVRPHARQSSPVRVPPQRAPPAAAFTLDDDMEVVQTYASPASTGIYGTPPRRSPAFDVAPEGGLATPPGFKGYTLGAWAENNTAKSSPVTPPPAVAAEAFERAVPMTSIELDTVEHAPVRQVFDEEGAPVCCALLGPFSPFFGGLCLLQTGSSTVLTSGSLAIMRIVQLLTATACAVSGAIISRGTRDASRIIPAAIAAAVGLRRLMLVASFRARRSDPKAIRQRSGYCGLDGFIVQTTGIIVLSFAAMEMFAYTSTAFEYLTGGPPDFDASLVLLMLLSVSVLMDVWVTPIPFRFAYILPALIINVFLVAISVTISGEQVNSRAIFMLVGAVSLLVGYVFHIYGRAVYLWVHRKKILAELNPSSTPLTGPPVDAIPSL